MHFLVWQVSTGSSAAHLEEYTELLPPTELMSPSDAKAGVNPNQVTLVGPEKLVAAGAQKRVDRVKIELTQPFAPREPHGECSTPPTALSAAPAIRRREAARFGPRGSNP